MKVQILQENLSKALSICSRFTSSRIQLPVLANVLLKAYKNKLLLSATNLETSVAISIGAKVLKEGDVTVPARVVAEIISNLDAGQIDLEVEKEALKIKTSSFNSVVSGLNSSDFPGVPTEVGVDSFKIDSHDFLDALNSVLFAVSNDETRPVLTGVLFMMNKDSLTLVATDGFRLSQKKINNKNIKSERKFILPKSVLTELSRVVDSESINVSYKKTDNQLIFGSNDLVLSSRVIEGEFPDFERIIPKDTKIQINLDKEDLLRSVKLAGVFARDSANVVKLTVSKDTLEISAESSQSGSQKNRLDAKIKNELSDSFTIAFNYRFLEDFLNAVKGESVILELSDPNAPALLLDDKDSNFLHIIMPVRLQG
jgi:DNA polymerase III subunit beta